MLECVNILIIFVILVGVAAWLLHNRKKIVIITPEYKKSHKRKETKLLNNILYDMKDNPEEWTQVSYNFSELKDASLINDKKNMAVILHADGRAVIIKINLKAAHKYREEEENIIATRIDGDHVVEFKRHAEEIMDSRGKELDFIETLLNRKL